MPLPHPTGLPLGSALSAEDQGFRGRHFCITLWTESPLEWNPTLMCYLTYQREECPDTHRLHWQTHLHTKKQLKLLTLRNKLNLQRGDAWITPARNPLASIKYCQKDDTRVSDSFFEFGERPTSCQGKRNDLDEVVAAIKSGKNIKQITIDHTAQVIKYHRGIQFAIGMHVEERVQKTRCEIYWGDTGTGKSHQVVASGIDYYALDTSKPGQIWFDGYYGQKTVLVDEMDGSVLRLDFFKRLCDAGRMHVPTKGGMVNFNAERIVFTSNKDPRFWWDHVDSCNYNAFVRRIDVCEEWRGRYPDVQKQAFSMERAFFLIQNL